MRTASSLILLTILLFNLFGFYIAFTVEQREIKEEMTALLQDKNEEHLQLLTFTKLEYDNIVWLETGKEFRLNGKMYDVERIETHKGIIRLFVAEDAKEMRLLNGFINLFASQSNNATNSSPVKNLLAHFMQDFILTPSGLPFYCVVISKPFTLQAIPPASYIPIGQSPPPDSFWS